MNSNVPQADVPSLVPLVYFTSSRDLDIGVGTRTRLRGFYTQCVTSQNELELVKIQLKPTSSGGNT